MDALIDEMAAKYKDDKKLDLDAAKAQLIEKMVGAESKMHGTTVRLLFTAALSLFFHFLSGFDPLEGSLRTVFQNVCVFRSPPRKFE